MEEEVHFNPKNYPATEEKLEERKEERKKDETLGEITGDDKERMAQNEVTSAMGDKICKGLILQEEQILIICIAR